MQDRRKVLELFESQKDFMDTTVKSEIERNRKGYATVTVKDKDGNVIPDAQVTAAQKTHEFKFGANLFMLDELETDEKNAAYKKQFADTFNMATLPFYWNATEPEKGHLRYDKDSSKFYRRPAIDLCMEFCEANGIEPREHALAYDAFFPKWLYNSPVSEIKKELETISKNALYGYIFKTLSSLCSVVEIKYGLGIRTRRAYKSGNKDELKKLISEYIELENRLNIFYKDFRYQWEKERKLNGFEKQDIRIGGLIHRVKNCREILEEYLSGARKEIPPLEEEILTFSKDVAEKEMLGPQQWHLSSMIKPFF